MIFLIIRHGNTDWNMIQRLQGREDIPLNAAGIEQAHVCGRALSGIRAEVILTSPLSRASKMAEILSFYTGSRIVTEPDLTERDYGVLSGKTPEGRDIFNPGEDTEGLEPLDEVSRRFLGVLRRYGTMGYGIIPVVSHGGSINAVLREITHGETGTGKIRIHNGGISIVSFSDGQFTVIKENIRPEEFGEYRQLAER